jgi:hypothetical protein
MHFAFAKDLTEITGYMVRCSVTCLHIPFPCWEMSEAVPTECVVHLHPVLRSLESDSMQLQ